MQKSFYRFIRTSLAHISAPLSGVAMAVVLAGFLLKPQIGISGENMAYFDNPMQAVDSIRTMLSSNVWDELSRYYDLSDTDIDRTNLISGDFFIRKKRPDVAHPAGFWKFKQPFSPQFTYLSHRNL